MFRDTGKGKFEVLYDDSHGSGSLTALLYNFDFDVFYGRKFRPLKKEHANFLDDKVLGLLASDRHAIWLQGRASRIGTNDWNMTTSMARASMVQTYLYQNGVKPDQVQPDAIGEEGTATHGEDDERDRSVMLWVQPLFKDDPKPPPKRVPPKPKVSQKFKLAMLTGVNVSQSAKIAKFLKGKLARGPAVDVIFFLMWDPTNSLACIYVYYGIGLSVGLSSLPKVSATMHGPWNEFTTTKPMGVWDFGKFSRFTTAGAWSWSVNWITIRTPAGIKDVYEKIDTGNTLGAGMSTTIGDFIRVEGPFRYTGP